MGQRGAGGVSILPDAGPAAPVCARRGAQGVYPDQGGGGGRPDAEADSGDGVPDREGADPSGCDGKKFYQELWKRFCDTLLISDRYQRAYFLLRTWLDPRIPYYRLGLGLRMDDETFQACVQQVELPFKKTRFAMNAGYPQKTQKASILMEIADAIPDQKQRVVFWALTLGRLEKEIVDLKRQVKALKACRAPTDPDGA